MSEKGANSDPSETCYIEQRVLAGMSQPSWEEVVELPDEVCPYPQLEAKKSVAGLESGNLPAQETDHIPSTENVPKAVGDDTETKVWQSGDGFYRRSGAADPHGRTERSGVNSSRPISGRSRGITFACDGTARFGTCDQNGEAAGLVPAVLHRIFLRKV